MKDILNYYLKKKYPYDVFELKGAIDPYTFICSGIVIYKKLIDEDLYSEFENKNKDELNLEYIIFKKVGFFDIVKYQKDGEYENFDKSKYISIY